MTPSANPGDAVGTEFTRDEVDEAYPAGYELHYWHCARSAIVRDYVGACCRTGDTVLEIGSSRGTMCACFGQPDLMPMAATSAILRFMKTSVVRLSEHRFCGSGRKSPASRDRGSSARCAGAHRASVGLPVIHHGGAAGGCFGHHCGPGAPGVVVELRRAFSSFPALRHQQASRRGSGFASQDRTAGAISSTRSTFRHGS